MGRLENNTGAPIIVEVNSVGIVLGHGGHMAIDGNQSLVIKRERIERKEWLTRLEQERREKRILRRIRIRVGRLISPE